MSPIRVRLIRLGAATFLPVMLLSAGCGLFERERDRNDPITSLPRRVPDDRRSVSATGTTNDNRSPAGLAGSSNSGLSIRDRDGNPASSNERDRDRNVQPTGWTGNTNSGKTNGPTLNTPTVNGRNDDRRSSPTNNNGMAPRIRSFEEGQGYLMAQGVRWQRLEQRDGEWAFECTVPSRNTSGSMRTYEARDKYGLVAIQKVIDNIARDQGR